MQWADGARCDRNSPLRNRVQTLHENEGYIMLLSVRVDGGMSERVGLVIAPEARSALRSWQPITSGVLIAEFLTCMGQLAIVVTYDSIEKSVSKENEYFIACLEGVVRSINGLVIIMGDFDARIGRQLKGVVGSTKQRGIRLTLVQLQA